MSFNALPQYPPANPRKRRGSNSLEESYDRLSAFNQSSLIPDHDSLPQWQGSVTNGARDESSHEFTLDPSAVSYATNLHPPETSFYDFGPPTSSYADHIPVDISGFGWNTTLSADTYPFPYQAFLGDTNTVYAPDPSARALPQVPMVPSQHSLASRELAPTVSSLYRRHQNNQSLPSAMPLHLALQHTTSETLVAPTVFPENPRLRGMSFTTALGDDLGDRRSSCSLGQYPADTVSTGAVSFPEALTVDQGRLITDPQNCENPLNQSDSTYTLENGPRMPDMIVNIDDPRDPPRYPLNRWIKIISQSHAPVDVRFGRFSQANISKKYDELKDRLKSLEILREVLPEDYTFVERVAGFLKRLEDETFRHFVSAGYVSLLIGRVGSIKKSYDNSLKAKPNAKPWLERSGVHGNFQVLEKDFLTINQAYRLKEAWKLNNLVLYHDF